MMRTPTTVAALLLFAAASSGIQASGAEATPTGRVIVGFGPGFLPAVAVGGSLAGLQVELVVPEGSFLVVAAPDLDTVREAVRDVPGVSYIESDLPIHPLATPDDPRWGAQYGPRMMGFPAAWDTGYGSSAVKVAVLDTGFQRSHPDFQPASRFLPGRDFVHRDGTPDDRCGHGTHTTGIVAAATGNGRSVAGMAQASVIPFKVLDATSGGKCAGTQSVAAQAMYAARDRGADVILMSFGASRGSTTLQDAVAAADKAGIVVVAAAGNGGTAGIDHPAAYASVVAVGAVTGSRVRASYSDTGPQLDVMAPGSGIESTTVGGGTGTRTGTSFAAAHVAGAVALALSCAPGATPGQVRQALAATAQDMGPSGFDQAHGHGLARADRLVARLCGVAPASATPNGFDAAFTVAPGSNEWWVEVKVAADQAVARVDVQVDGGAWQPLSKTDWGAWAKSIHVPRGTPVQFRATSTSGATDHSGVQAWLGGATSTATPAPADPDPATPNLSPGVARSVSLGAGGEAFAQVYVKPGVSRLKVEMTGPACGLFGCSFDAALSTRHAAKPTDATHDCRPYLSGNKESCTHAGPQAGWWYVRVESQKGSGTVQVKATVS